MSGVAAAVAAAAGALALATIGAGRRRPAPRGLVRMRAIRAIRDPPRGRGLYNREQEMQDFLFEGKEPEKAKNHHPPHLRGWALRKHVYEERKPPARQALGRIFDPLSVFKRKELASSPPASLDAADVKEIGTYMVPKGTSEVVSPAKVPEYLAVKVRTWLERSFGAKRPPQDDDEYKEYADRRCTLSDAATKVVPDSLSHDFVVDRAALLALLDYVGNILTPFLRKKGQRRNPIDLVKISKTEDGKALVLDCLYDKIDLFAEQPLRRLYFDRQPEERPLGGFQDALERVVTGDRDFNMHVRGYSQHSRENNLPKCYKFLEIPLDGMKLTVRAPKSHVHKGRRSLDDEVVEGVEKAVEIKYTNFRHPSSMRLLDTYFRMLLGKVDIFSFSLQSNGYFKSNQEFSIEDLTSKNPELKGVADQHLGRVTNLLKQVSEKITADGGDGPWVLQWRNGPILLGKYELAPLLEVESEDLEEEILMA